MVHPGYIAEVVVLEVVFVTLLVLSSLEIYHAGLPKNRAGLKSLQKVLFPSVWLSSLVGSIVAIDFRGVFGIYSSVPVFVRLWFALWIVFFLMLYCFVWQLTMWITIGSAEQTQTWICFASRLSEPKTQNIIIVAYGLLLASIITLSAGLMVMLDNFVYSSVLWMYTAYTMGVAQTIHWRIWKLAVGEIRRLTVDGGGLSGHMIQERQQVARKFFRVMITSSAIICCAIGSAIAQLSSKDKISVDSVFKVDADVYEPSWSIAVTVSGMFTTYFTALLNLGTVLRPCSARLQLIPMPTLNSSKPVATSAT
eukprot:TRINITY_DN5629_c0_g4_i2.p1 TRINITY_DN5629_c0_g4~~TRINITY_DN5629_c0_g4_i2.p1  ORF type:complete len:309 (-),score=68.66 TRINITY_DN5629_c0_g4_i2:1026-1952(-)